MQTLDSNQSLAVAPPAGAPPAAGVPEPISRVSVLGVEIVDLSLAEAIHLLQHMLAAPVQHTQTLYFVNAHTLNLAYENEAYRATLNTATCVFGDGTGVRWGARLKGVRLKANLNGTDVMPALMAATDTVGYRYFLLGAKPSTVTGAAQACLRHYPGWQLVGCHHGFSNEEETAALIERINQARPHMLLVGMGNPLQEQWIDRYRDQLHVPLCVGVGGLFNYLSGDVDRAPGWLRRLGHEWVHVLWRHKYKWRRYLVGNPKFLFRIVRRRSQDRF
ncbi:MAG TPA: WecB/TagA/CpsF family glycosyltransferase [Pirellulales bacterium]|jgi:N-acetylglucosaminyldiphosphoundecaprenol N-acetyl-beta-D-mannosaminyltransferase|nr:WecB/TagA/CpsF family glycosyltransferase [Pirellulales bacterium]